MFIKMWQPQSNPHSNISYYCNELLTQFSLQTRKMRKTLILILALLLIVSLPIVAFYNAIILYAGNHGRIIFNEHSAIYFFAIFFFIAGPILLIVLIKKIDSLTLSYANFFRIISLIITTLLTIYSYYTLPKLVHIYFILSSLILVSSIALTVLLFMPLRTLK